MLPPPAYTSIPSLPPFADSPTSLPPAYSPSPSLSRAMEEYRLTQDPSSWGTRKTTTRRFVDSAGDSELTGLLGWVKWFAELMATPGGMRGRWDIGPAGPAGMVMGMGVGMGW